MIQNAKIVGDGIASEDYLKQLQGVKRGDPQFVMHGGELATFSECPWAWIRGKESKGTKSTEFGDLVDCLLLDPKRFNHAFVCHPEMYPCKPTAKDPRTEKPWTMKATYCEEWATSQSGKTIIKTSTLKEARDAVAVVRDDTVAAELIDCCRKQVMVVGEFHDTKTGISVPIKCLIDLEPPKDHPKYGEILADFKTARSASPFWWARQVFEYGYAQQAARELDLHNAATGERRSGFHHIVCENEAPYAVSTQFLGGDFIGAIGRCRYEAALRFYCECLKTNKWPNYREMAQKKKAVVIEGWIECKPEEWMTKKDDYVAMLPETSDEAIDRVFGPQNDRSGHARNVVGRTQRMEMAGLRPRSGAGRKAQMGNAKDDGCNRG